MAGILASGPLALNTVSLILQQDSPFKPNPNQFYITHNNRLVQAEVLCFGSHRYITKYHFSMTLLNARAYRPWKKNNIAFHCPPKNETIRSRLELNLTVDEKITGLT